MLIAEASLVMILRIVIHLSICRDHLRAMMQRRERRTPALCLLHRHDDWTATPVANVSRTSPLGHAFNPSTIAVPRSTTS